MGSPRHERDADNRPDVIVQPERAAARCARGKPRSCEAAFASSTNQLGRKPSGRKPLYTVSPRRRKAGRRVLLSEPPKTLAGDGRHAKRHCAAGVVEW